MGGDRKGWYAREEVKKVTADWVKSNCRLTKREMELIKVIHKRKLVRRDHLEIVCEPYRNLGENRVRLLNRSIKKLFSQMVIDKAHEVQEIGRGNTPSIISIDKGGSIILGVPHKKRITHKIHTYKGIDYITRVLPINYRHINGINQTEVDTILFCEETGHKLLQWELEVNLTYMHNGEEKIFIPDVFMELDFGSKQLLSFIEYDTGSENYRYKKDFPIIYDKLLNYRRWKASKVWIEDYKYFPMILLVTEDDKRIPYFNNKCKEFGLEGFGVYHERYTDFIGHLSKMV